MGKRFSVSILLLAFFVTISYAQSAYTADNDMGGKIIDDVTILSISYVSDTCCGGFHRPGQFQIQISSTDPIWNSDLTWLLTSPEDIAAGAADINILYSTLLSAFNNNQPVLLNIKPSENNLAHRWYVRAVQIKRR